METNTVKRYGSWQEGRWKRGEECVWTSRRPSLLASLAAATSAFCCISSYRGRERLSASFAGDESVRCRQNRGATKQFTEYKCKIGVGEHVNMPLRLIVIRQRTSGSLFLINFKDFG